MKPTTDSVALPLDVRSARSKLNRAWNGAARSMLLPLILVGGISSGSALARTVIVEIAPPPARVEVIPAQRRGYTWAPGYWGWQRNQHVWVRGHSIRTRSGYTWQPDRWNQVDNRHHYQAGHWTRSELHGQ